jgi:GTP pyrophosphokinase
MMQKEFQHEGYEYADKSLDGVLKKFKSDTAEDLLAQVGQGNLGAREVVNAVFPGSRPVPANDKVIPIGRPRPKTKRDSFAVPIRGLIPGMALHFAGCCHPLPGDRIVGIVTTGKGVTIHTIDCETLETFADTPERWLDVAWDVDPDSAASHVGRLNVVITNQPGSLGSLTTVIGKNNGNINNLKIVNRSSDFFEVLVDVEVKDLRHLTGIIAALRATPAISSVDRARG